MPGKMQRGKKMNAVIILMLAFTELFAGTGQGSYQPTSTEISNYINACIKYRPALIVELRKEQRILLPKKKDADAQQQLEKIATELAYLNDKKNLPKFPLVEDPKIGSIGTLPTDWKISTVRKNELVADYTVPDTTPHGGSAYIQSGSGYADSVLAGSLSAGAPRMMTKHAVIKDVNTKSLLPGRAVESDDLFYVAGESSEGLIIYALKNMAAVEAAWQAKIK
jgi:hypothetical protein